MRSFSSLGVLCLVALSASAADAATIAGTVKGPDGAPFRGAFVQARNATTKITVSVLSDSQGHYQVPDLTAGDYRLAIRAPGFKSDPKTGIKLTADQHTVHSYGEEAMKIVFVQYETPGPNRMPWSAYPDKEGKFWIPYYGRANKIGQLDPISGVITEYPVPETGTAAIHSAVPAPD